MKIRAKAETIEAAVRAANEKYYHGNIQLDNGQNYPWQWGGSNDRTGRFYHVSIRVKDSTGAGHRLSAVHPVARSDQRRLTAACWHVFRDVLAELFTLEPEAVAVTAAARYEGLEGFRREFPGTYYRQAGSRMLPQDYGDLCECCERLDFDWNPRGVA